MFSLEYAFFFISKNLNLFPYLLLVCVYVCVCLSVCMYVYVYIALYISSIDPFIYARSFPRKQQVLDVELSDQNYMTLWIPKFS